MFKNTSPKFKRRVAVQIFVLAAVVVATAVAAYFYGLSQGPAGLGAEDQENLELYAEALDRVQDDYVDQEAVKPRQQTYAAIEGMLGSLGDEGHTRFLTPEEREQNQRGLSGTYVGVGIQLENKKEEVVVAAPIEGSPAERAGVQTGDIIIAVNGNDIRGDEISKIAERVRGPEGTEVEITVLRGDEEREFTLERAEIQSPVTSWNLVPGTNVAHVRLASFTDDSAEKLEEAFAEARDAGAERFILDFRNNPGGKLDQALDIAGQFLKTDSVVYLRKDASEDREEIKVPRGADPTDAPPGGAGQQRIGFELRDTGRSPAGQQSGAGYRDDDFRHGHGTQRIHPG